MLIAVGGGTLGGGTAVAVGRIVGPGGVAEANVADVIGMGGS